MRNTYNKRRKYMLSRLREMGFVIKTEPLGSFLYIGRHATKFTKDSSRFAFDVLEKAHVGITRALISEATEKDFDSHMPTRLRISKKSLIDWKDTYLDYKQMIYIDSYRQTLNVNTLQ
ncbi:hypothetical protein MASR1M31_12040 [Porphyromonadaceae bacterium]